MAAGIVDLPINSMVDLSSSLCKRLPEGNTKDEGMKHLQCGALATKSPLLGATFMTPMKHCGYYDTYNILWLYCNFHGVYIEKPTYNWGRAHIVGHFLIFDPPLN